MKKINARSLWIVGMGLILGCGFSVGISAQEPNYMNVHTIGGVEAYSIPLDDIHKITFDDSYVSLFYKEKAAESLSFDMFEKITFSDQPDAIEEVVSTAGPQIVYRGVDHQLEVTATLPIEILAVYNIQGRVMMQLSPRTESVSLSLAELPAGIYIVRAGNSEKLETKKIIKH